MDLSSQARLLLSSLIYNSGLVNGQQGQCLQQDTSVRAKAKSPVEFGAKLSVSLVDGYSFVDTLSWDAFNESGDLIDQVEAYRQRFGRYPASVHVDKIYRTRENRRFCKMHGIRMSGPALGRPKQPTDMNKAELAQARRQQRQDELDRNAIEGKFGQGKRRFTLNRIMAKLAATSEAIIMVSFIVMNLEKILTQVLSSVNNLFASLWMGFQSLWRKLMASRDCVRCFGVRPLGLEPAVS